MIMNDAVHTQMGWLVTKSNPKMKKINGQLVLVGITHFDEPGKEIG